MSGRGRIIVVVGCHSRDKVLEGIDEGRLLVGHVAASIGARVARRDGGRRLEDSANKGWNKGG
jgi:hypothetical protein